MARAHRGHRLGLLLKIDMMRWLAEAEPQVEVIETWNNVDNDFMINVNEALGYRLSRVFATYELNLGSSSRSGSEAEPVEVLGVALPFLEHLDPQIEIDRGAEQGFDLLPGGRPDLAQPSCRGGR